MGFQDRDYYREDPRRGDNFAGISSIWKVLIAVNVVIYLLQMLTLNSRGGGVTEWFELSATGVFKNFEVWRLLTCTFCHDPHDLWHLIFNMFGLWLFGNLVEEVYGSREFLKFYLTAAILSSIGFLAVELTVNHFALREIPPMLGASGTVMGVVMVCAFLFPRLKVYVMYVIPVELRWLAAAAVVLDLYPVVLELGGDHAYDHVAHSSHLAGLAYGFCYRYFDLRYSRLFSGNFWKNWRRSFRLAARKRRTDIKLHTPIEEPHEYVDSASFDRQVDEILAKISANGESSLTDAERNLLKEASRRYRRN